jgi:hypothetical protein
MIAQSLSVHTLGLYERKFMALPCDNDLPSLSRIIPGPTARSAVRGVSPCMARLLIQSGYLHPGKGTNLQSLKFINNRGRMAMVHRSWVAIFTDLKNMADYHE